MATFWNLLPPRLLHALGCYLSRSLQTTLESGTDRQQSITMHIGQLVTVCKPYDVTQDADRGGAGILLSVGPGQQLPAGAQ